MPGELVCVEYGCKSIVHWGLLGSGMHIAVVCMSAVIFSVDITSLEL